MVVQNRKMTNTSLLKSPTTGPHVHGKQCSKELSSGGDATFILGYNFLYVTPNNSPQKTIFIGLHDTRTYTGEGREKRLTFAGYEALVPKP